MKTRYCNQCGQPILMDDTLNVNPPRIRYFRPTEGETTAEEIHDCPRCGNWLGVSSLGEKPKATDGETIELPHRKKDHPEQ